MSPNTRINAPPDDSIQPTSQSTMLMKGKLRIVELKELLCGALIEPFRVDRSNQSLDSAKYSEAIPLWNLRSARNHSPVHQTRTANHIQPAIYNVLSL